MALNMCMFATRMEYDAAVRQQWEADKSKNVVKNQHQESSSNKNQQSIDENQ